MSANHSHVQFLVERVARFADIDTRRLTRILRDKGAQDGCLMAGNVFAAYGQRLPAGPRLLAWPSATALLRLAPALLAAGGAGPADQALPSYIRDDVAQTMLQRAARNLR